MFMTERALLATRKELQAVRYQLSAANAHASAVICIQRRDHYAAIKWQEDAAYFAARARALVSDLITWKAIR